MGFHPYALQQCFRSAAAHLLNYPENEMTIFFGEALESLLLRNDFVDAQVLSAIWPLEFDRFKVLIVRVDHNGRIESFSSFRSEAGPVDEFGEWSGEELIFTLQVLYCTFHVSFLPVHYIFWHTLTHYAYLPCPPSSGTTSRSSSRRASSCTGPSPRCWRPRA